MRSVGQPFSVWNAVQKIKRNLEVNVIDPAKLLWVHYPTKFADPCGDITQPVVMAVQEIRGMGREG